MDGDVNTVPKNCDWALRFRIPSTISPQRKQLKEERQPLFRKNTTGVARSQEQPPGDGGCSCRTSIEEETRNHMATKVCCINGATCGIGTEIATTWPGDSNQVAATGRQPAAVTPRFSDNLLPVALDVTPKDQAEVAGLRPIIAVAFTVGGPVVYQQSGDQFA
jgi:hypothetical protein